MVLVKKTGGKNKKSPYDKGDTVQVTGIINKFVDGVPQIFPLDSGVEKISSASAVVEIVAPTTRGYTWPVVGLGVSSVGAGWWYKKRQKKMSAVAV